MIKTRRLWSKIINIINIVCLAVTATELPTGTGQQVGTTGLVRKEGGPNIPNKFSEKTSQRIEKFIGGDHEKV